MDVRGAISDETLAKVWQEMARLRKLRGLTQQELADEADITQGAVSRIENGSLYPSLENQQNLAKVLKFDDVHTFFETMAKLALYPSSMTDWDFGGNELSEKHLKAFIEFKAKAEQQGLNDPKEYDRLMEAYNFSRAIHETQTVETPPEEILNDMDVLQSVPEHDAVRESKRIMSDTDNHLLKADDIIAQSRELEKRLEQGIASLKPKRGRSLLNYGTGKFGEGAYGGKGDSNAPKMMPLYKKEATKFDVWGALHASGEAIDRTVVPPMLAHATDPYAVEVSTDHMAPRYSKGDRLYVDTNANPYYGDDVIVTLLEKGELYVCATRIVKMKTHTDGNGNEWQGYGCIATQDEQYLYEEALKERWGQDTFNEERNKNIDWFFVLTRTPEVADKKRDMREYPDGMGDVNHLLARSVHVVIGCERKRISDNFTRPNPRQKRQMEAAQDAEWQLTPYIGYTQDEQDWLQAELDRDFEE